MKKIIASVLFLMFLVPVVALAQIIVDGGKNLSVVTSSDQESIGWFLGGFDYKNATQQFSVFTYQPVKISMWAGSYLASTNCGYYGQVLIKLDGLYDEYLVFGLYREVGTSTGAFSAHIRSNRLELKIGQKVYVGQDDFEVSTGSKIIGIKLLGIKDGKAIVEVWVIG